MDTMPLSFVIFGAIPEALLMIYFGLTMIGIRPKLLKVFIAAILQAVAIYFIRKYVSFGPHLVLTFLSMIVLTWLVVKVPLIHAALSSFLTLTVNLLIEGPYSFIVEGLTGLSYIEIISREMLRLVYFIPKLIIQALLLAFCLKYHFTIEEELNILKKLSS